MTLPRQEIRIVRAPTGEAPAWVREAWIGLDLPLAQPCGDGPRTWRGAGVLTGPKSLMGALWHLVIGRGERINGYAVVASEAIALLDAHAPNAASWWRENAGHMLKSGQVFLFNEAACQINGD